MVDSFKLVGMLLGDVGAPLGALEDNTDWLGVGPVLFGSVGVGSVDVGKELVGLSVVGGTFKLVGMLLVDGALVVEVGMVDDEGSMFDGDFVVGDGNSALDDDGDEVTGLVVCDFVGTGVGVTAGLVGADVGEEKVWLGVGWSVGIGVGAHPLITVGSEEMGCSVGIRTGGPEIGWRV